MIAQFGRDRYRGHWAALLCAVLGMAGLTEVRSGKQPDPNDVLPTQPAILLAEMPMRPLPNGSGVGTQSSGEVYGTLRIGQQPSSQRKLRLSSFHRIPVEYDMRTDAQGHFEKTGVPPGRYTLLAAVRLPNGQTHYGPASQPAAIRVGANKRTRFDLTWHGQPVVGRFVIKAQDRTRRWNHSLATLLSLDFGQPKETNGFARILRVDPDGWFGVPDVPPGDYRVGLTVHWPEDELPAKTGAKFDRKMGWGGREFHISADGPSPTLLNLGDINLNFKRELKPGDPAPALAGSTWDGEVVRLDQFRGRHVLLHFWDSTPGHRADALETLRAVYREYGNDPRLAIVGVHVGGPNSKDYATNQRLDWNLCQLASADRQRILDDYGFGGCPWIFLIGPDGRIAAANLLGRGLQAAVRQALGSARGDKEKSVPP